MKIEVQDVEEEEEEENPPLRKRKKTFFKKSERWRNRMNRPRENGVLQPSAFNFSPSPQTMLANVPNDNFRTHQTIMQMIGRGQQNGGRASSAPPSINTQAQAMESEPSEAAEAEKSSDSSEAKEVSEYETDEDEMPPDSPEEPNNIFEAVRVGEFDKYKGFRGRITNQAYAVHELNLQSGLTITDAFLTDYMASLENVIDGLMKDEIRRAEPTDYMQVIILCKSNTRHPISTPFFEVQNYNVSLILTPIMKAAQSGFDLRISNGVEIVVRRVKCSGNTAQIVGGRRFINRNMSVASKNKRSIVEIPVSNDMMCFPRALAICLAKRDKDHCFCVAEELHPACEHSRFYKHMCRKDRVFQTEQAQKLCERIGIDNQTPCGKREAKKFEDVLGIYIKIIGGDVFQEFVYDGTKTNIRPDIPIEENSVVYILRRLVPSSPTSQVHHYDAIVNIVKFFGKSHFCIYCNCAYKKIQSHKCPDIQNWCYSCWQRDCPGRTGLPNDKKCKICGEYFADLKCQKFHEEQQVCHKEFYCISCRQPFTREQVLLLDGTTRLETNFEAKLKHRCSKSCPVCKQTRHGATHQCFIQNKPFNKPSEKLLFLDFETEQSTGLHVPIFCHVIWFCTETASWREKSFGLNRENFNIRDEICVWLFSKKFRGYTVLAHNMKGFDGCILLQYLAENNIKPQCIFSGSKITKLEISKLDMRIIDSLNFLPMPLAHFAAAFGLTETKGYFPHFFSSPENFDYIGPIPAPEFYGSETMSPKNREKFFKWYADEKAKNEDFDFAKSIRHYCRQDVVVLRDGCIAFKKILMQLTGDQCDPFQYTTLAGVAAAIYKARYLKEKTIAAVPPDGYASHQRFSSESLEWLEFLRQCRGVSNMKHAANSPTGEASIGPYQIDGIDEDNKTVYEYYGCFYHGCSKCCGKNFGKKNPVIGKTYHALNDDTLKKERFLESLGWKVVSVWACDWKNQKETDEEIKSFIQANEGKFSPLNPFEAFYGGRVETFKMCVDDGKRKMRYVDFTSLYPFINATKKYPVGHPEILMSDFGDLDSVCDRFFGFIKCRILPPRKLYIPVLPGRFGKDVKLLFPLCRTCASQRKPRKTCRHSDDKRALHQTWFTEEVKKAVEMGYKILEVDSVYHFKETSTDLFSDYIRLFYKMKLISSGKPPGCETREALQKYIDDVAEREKISLKHEDFENNPSMRQISKLLINSLWGRFGLRRILPFHKFVSDIENIVDMLKDPGIEVSAINAVHEDLAFVIGKKNGNECVDINNDANIYIAAATTAYARLELYEKMQILKDRVVYCDTDSIVYIDKEGDNLACGPFLGELTNELRLGDLIIRFVSGGPKNYAYQTILGDVCLKVKGFSLNYSNCQAFTLDKMKRVILSTAANELSEDDEFDENIEPAPKPLKILNRKEKRERNRKLRFEAYLGGHYQNMSKPSAIAGENFISLYNPQKISREKNWQLVSKPEQKLYTVSYDKRVVLSDFETQPFGY